MRAGTPRPPTACVPLMPLGGSGSSWAKCRGPTVLHVRLLSLVSLKPETGNVSPLTYHFCNRSIWVPKSVSSLPHCPFGHCLNSGAHNLASEFWGKLSFDEHITMSSHVCRARQEETGVMFVPNIPESTARTDVWGGQREGASPSILLPGVQPELPTGEVAWSPGPWPHLPVSRPLRASFCSLRVVFSSGFSWPLLEL